MPQAIRAALEQGRGALVLVPEIALAVPLLDRLRFDLNVEVALLHSALGDGERADEWRRIRAGEVKVVVGTRIAALAPLADPGVIIVDEEHDPAYKSDRTPRYQARDVAIELGRLAERAGRAGQRHAGRGHVRPRDERRDRARRRCRASPARDRSVEIVDLRAELAAGNKGLLSERLSDGARSARHGASATRRSWSSTAAAARSVVVCAATAATSRSARSASDRSSSTPTRCRCAAITVARRRPSRGAARHATRVRIRYLGGGTQRVEREVQIRFPHLRVARLDRDVVERKGEATRIVDAFADGELDVLVGTALVTKGLDVPAGDARRRRLGRHRAQPARRARRRAHVPAAGAGRSAARAAATGRARRSSRRYLPDHPVIAAVATGTRPSSTTTELALASAVRLAAVRRA